jgi:hypothetical protein
VHLQRLRTRFGTTTTMANLLPLGQGPKVVVYHQTHHGPNNGPPVSLLPLIANNTGVTHVIVAAIHLNDPPGHITINDDHPEHEKYGTLYGEMAWLQGLVEPRKGLMSDWTELIFRNSRLTMSHSATCCESTITTGWTWTSRSLCL